MNKRDYNKKIREIEQKIRISRLDEKNIINFVNDLNNKLNRKIITKEEYDRLLKKRLEGKTLSEYIAEKKKKEREFFELKNRYENDLRRSNNISFTVISIFLLLGIFLFFKYPVFTGYVVQGQENITVENVSLSFSENENYSLTLQNNIDSFLVSGKIIGSGDVKVYLNDKQHLVLDSSKLREQNNLVTGMAIGESEKEINENKTIINKKLVQKLRLKNFVFLDIIKTSQN